MPGQLAVCEATEAGIAALQLQAVEKQLTLRAPPPEPLTCCGRGCNGCVWEGYYSAVNYWIEDATAALRTGKMLLIR